MNTHKGNALVPVLALLAIVAVIVIILVVNNKTPEEDILIDQATDMMHEGERMIENGEKMVDEAEKMMEDERPGAGNVMYEGEVLAGSTTPYIAFNQLDFEQAFADGKYVMLVFYANWCPTCKAEQRNATFPAFDELNRNDVVAFRVNFNDNQTDSFERDLAREHGVAYQHVKVFYAPDTSVIEKTGPVTWTKQQYLDFINNL